MDKIRNATPGDIGQLIRVKPSLSYSTAAERITRQTQGLVEFLVYEKDGEIVSFIYLKWHGKTTHPEYPDLEDLFTREDRRGNGYGSLLITECEKLAKDKGFAKIGLAVNPDLNGRAKLLYEKLGYRHDGLKKYVDGIYNGIEDWCLDLEKSLVV